MVGKILSNNDVKLLQRQTRSIHYGNTINDKGGEGAIVRYSYLIHATEVGNKVQCIW